MSSTPIFTILLFFLAFLVTTAHFNTCSEPFFLFVTHQKKLTFCKKLTTLGAEFGWSINKTDDDHHRIDMIFGAKLNRESGWLAWGVNPDKMPQMVGTRAIIGIRHENGSSFTNTYNITSDTKLKCKLTPTELFASDDGGGDRNEVKFRNVSMEYFGDLSYFTIQASVVLPVAAYNVTRVNHVWQVGYELDGVNPKNHPTALQNDDSSETINLTTENEARHVGEHRRFLRMVHGIVNIMGWGFFMPIGVIIARYSKYPLGIKKRWFGLHVSCQMIGYILGTTGWVIGLSLGTASKFYIFRTHRLYAMFIFSFTTLQMLALRLKPEKNDEYRKHWNMYHHFLGYALLGVISINIFNGIDILKPDMTWKWIYTGILIAFAAIVAALEIFTWTKFKTSVKPTAPAPQQGPGSTTTTLCPPSKRNC
ncbi:cytochrome b561 and DOMON domain-containing protein At3g25290-like [Mercurialis annua]|uniref:cytochrome b561 and DOMON domain-containing protein At3g25290-like n=1 Tax=Mercurialis annua TaxID=3986 RepID=UPI00215E93AA|nr:cytochrome b561 and DOMON domain-containing protein At3g25290-like [Mercurialis annua]